MITDTELEIITLIKGVYKFIKIENNHLVFHEIFNGEPDPDYVSLIYVDEENDWISAEWIVGPKTHEMYKEKTWEKNEWDKEDFYNLWIK